MTEYQKNLFIKNCPKIGKNFDIKINLSDVIYVNTQLYYYQV